MDNSQPKPKYNAADDPEFVALRDKMLTIFPEMKPEINKMDKDDLEQLLAIAEQPEGPSKSTQIKNKMVKQILHMFPDMENQLSHLDQKDIKDIYEEIIGEKQKAKVKLETISFPKQRPKTQPKSEHIPKNIIMTTPDGELNVYEMKRTLIQRLPEFRNEIRNLPDQEIKAMFRDLEQQQNRIRESEKKGKKPGINPNMFSQTHKPNMYQNYNYPYQNPYNHSYQYQSGPQKIADNPSTKSHDYYSTYNHRYQNNYLNHFEDLANNTALPNYQDCIEYAHQLDDDEDFQQENAPRPGLPALEATLNSTIPSRTLISEQKDLKCKISFYLSNSDQRNDMYGNNKYRDGLNKIIQTMSANNGNYTISQY